MDPREQYEEWVTINGAAELTGVSRRTIYNWIAASKLRTTRTASGSIRILAASLWQSYDGPRDPPRAA